MNVSPTQQQCHGRYIHEFLSRALLKFCIPLKANTCLLLYLAILRILIKDMFMCIYLLWR